MMIYSCVGSKTYKKYSEVLIHFMSDGSFSGRVVWPPRIVKEVLKSEQEINSNSEFKLFILLSSSDYHF